MPGCLYVCALCACARLHARACHVTSTGLDTHARMPARSEGPETWNLESSKELFGRTITQTLQEVFAKCGLYINKATGRERDRERERERERKRTGLPKLSFAASCRDRDCVQQHNSAQHS